MSGHIEARGLGVSFALDRHARPLTPALARVRRARTHIWGLRSLDLTIAGGEAVALVGATGSGKTTLLRAIAEVLPADAGCLEVRGRVGPLLDVDAGLLGPLTGRENAELLTVLAGLPRAGLGSRLEDLAASSRLGAAFEHPVSSYSQGMRARLAFAVAEAAGPDVLVLDEVHEALDHEFRDVVAARARALLERGGIVVAAGHDHALLGGLCERAVWLRDGAVEADGPFAEVVAAYRAGGVR